MFSDEWQHCTLGLRLLAVCRGYCTAIRLWLRWWQVYSEPHSVLSRAGRSSFTKPWSNCCLLGCDACCRLLLTGAGVSHGESEPVLIGDWLLAAKQLKLPVLAGDSQRLSLDDHPQWDHLVGSVLNHATYCGW